MRIYLLTRPPSILKYRVNCQIKMNIQRHSPHHIIKYCVFVIIYVTIYNTILGHGQQPELLQVDN